MVIDQKKLEEAIKETASFMQGIQGFEYLDGDSEDLREVVKCILFRRDFDESIKLAEELKHGS